MGVPSPGLRVKATGEILKSEGTAPHRVGRATAPQRANRRGLAWRGAKKDSNQVEGTCVLEVLL